MYEYIKGKIVNVTSTYIVLENNDIGYLIYVGNPYSYVIGKEYTVYIYQHIREEENTLYGFKTLDEKDTFLRLIQVKGLGPKMALPLLAGGEITTLWNAIENEDVFYLKKFPKIGDKVAHQIILDLKGKISKTSGASDTASLTELVEVLKGLGYKQADINGILKHIDVNIPIEAQVKESLKLLSK